MVTILHDFKYQKSCIYVYICIFLFLFLSLSLYIYIYYGNIENIVGHAVPLALKLATLGLDSRESFERGL